MHLVRYKLTHPRGDPIPFHAWFAHDPQGQVHALDMSFDRDDGRACYLVQPSDPSRLPAMLADVVAAPATNCHHWRLRGQAFGLGLLRGLWREPIYPGVYSPMAVAVRTFGRGTSCSVTLRRDAVHHRVLVPESADPDSLWPALRVEMDRYAGFTQVPIEATHEGTEEVDADDPLARVRVELPGDGQLAWSYARLAGL